MREAGERRGRDEREGERVGNVGRERRRRVQASDARQGDRHRTEREFDPARTRAAAQATTRATTGRGGVATAAKATTGAPRGDRTIYLPLSQSLSRARSSSGRRRSGGRATFAGRQRCVAGRRRQRRIAVVVFHRRAASTLAPSRRVLLFGSNTRGFDDRNLLGCQLLHRRAARQRKPSHRLSTSPSRRLSTSPINVTYCAEMMTY